MIQVSAPPFDRVVVRAYVSTDLPALMALFFRAVRETAAAHYDAEQIRAWAPDSPDAAVWRERLEARPTFVAERGGAMAGFSDLEPDGRIDMLFVHPDHGRRGVAAALLDHVEREARDRNIARLRTEASLTARPVFERHGFQIVAAQDVELRGRSFRNFRMDKSLNDGEG